MIRMHLELQGMVSNMMTVEVCVSVWQVHQTVLLLAYCTSIFKNFYNICAKILISFCEFCESIFVDVVLKWVCLNAV